MMINFLKKIAIIIVLSLMHSCGTTGRIQFYNFNISKDSLENCLLTVINMDSLYSAPSKWNDYELGVDTVYDIFVSFHSGPKEIYQISFIGPPTDWKVNNSCKLALVGVFDGKLWHFANDLNFDEEYRVMKRFEIEILSKLEISYTKSY